MFCKKNISHRIDKIVPVLARATETTKNLIMKRMFQEHPSNTMGATNGARTAYPSEHLSSSLFFSGVRVAQSLVFCVMYCRLLFFVFLLIIVLSVLRFTDYDYTFGIF